MFPFFPSAFKKRAKKSPPGGQNDPQERPGRSQERPKRPQDGPKTAPNAARSAPRGAKTAPRAPKSLGRCSKNFGSVLQGRPGAPKTRQEPFGRPAGSILTSFWVAQGLIVHLILASFSKLARAPLHNGKHCSKSGQKVLCRFVRGLGLESAAKPREFTFSPTKAFYSSRSRIPPGRVLKEQGKGGRERNHNERFHVFSGQNY